jgi:hypothetical protein
MIPLERVAELVADAVGPVDGVDLAIYGSTGHRGLLVGDLDIWIAGDQGAWPRVEQELLVLALRTGITVDLARDGCDEELDVAVRWCVHQDGLMIAGTRPSSPVGMTEATAEAAYRAAVTAQARAFALRADILARAQLPSARVLTEAALRTWLRSTAANRHDERALRRSPAHATLTRVETVDPLLAALLRTADWSSVSVTRRLLALMG